MNNLIHLLKELEVPAITEGIFITPFDSDSDQSAHYQMELDFNNHSKKQ
ncbi:hypothetical protein [Bacillus massiliigorillae]|nr:hypothetical protein [Bacillus massiliigorillae]